MRLFRSILFLFLFYFTTLIQMVFWMPAFFLLPRQMAWPIPRFWALFSLWLQHVIIGSRYSFRGVENLPKSGGWIFASKHQSTWETYTKLLFAPDPSYILKRELMYVPFFGWYIWKAQVIAVDRGKRSEALRAMAKEAERQYLKGRHIVIYPEGTRKTAYADPAYKYGITHLYLNTGAPVVPVAINSGLFWPRNSLQLYKGTIIMEFLPPIESGLAGDEFSARLQEQIETKTNELLAEGESDPEYDGKGLFKPGSQS